MTTEIWPSESLSRPCKTYMASNLFPSIFPLYSIFRCISKSKGLPLYSHFSPLPSIALSSWLNMVICVWLSPINAVWLHFSTTNFSFHFPAIFLVDILLYIVQQVYAATARPKIHEIALPVVLTCANSLFFLVFLARGFRGCLARTPALSALLFVFVGIFILLVIFLYSISNLRQLVQLKNTTFAKILHQKMQLY